MLVCCWVAIKEVSMLLGTMLARLPLPDPNRPAEKVREKEKKKRQKTEEEKGEREDREDKEI